METNIVEVKKDAQSFLTIGNSLLENSISLIIKKQEDANSASLILKQCQNTEKDLEAKRVSIMSPIRTFVNEVNSLFKDTSIPLLQAKELVKKKIVAFNLEIEVKRLQEQKKRNDEERLRLKKIEDARIAREKIEMEKRNAEEERLKKMKEASPEYQAEQKKQEAERQKRLAGEEKKRIAEEKRIANEKLKADTEKAKLDAINVKGINKRFTYEIVDSSKIPVIFCSPDSKKINDAIKLGVREIKGLKIYEVTSVK